MSRIGKMILSIPAGVTLNFNKETHSVQVNGPKGMLELVTPNFISVVEEESNFVVKIEKEQDKKQRSNWGTYRALINNMLIGVSLGFNRTMELNGVGYKMELVGQTLTLYIGYSHPVKVNIPNTIKLSLNKNILEGESISKHELGDFFMKIHNMKPCDVYKQKGFKIPGRFYRKKVGKKAK